MIDQMRQMTAQISSVDFWAEFFVNVAHMGPLVPLLMAAVESFFPPLPLIGVVTFNIMSHGVLWGFLYSWVGTCAGSTLVFLFFRWVGKKSMTWWSARPKASVPSAGWPTGKSGICSW